MGAELMLVKPTARGMLTLPKELRADWDENTLLDVILRSDGVIELRPKVVIDAASRPAVVAARIVPNPVGRVRKMWGEFF